MKVKVWTIALFIFALLDNYICYAYPADFQYQVISYVPHFCFLMLMLLVMEMDMRDRMLIGMTCGILTDLFITDSFPVHMILYTLLSGFVGLIPFRKDVVERFLVCLLMLVLVDVVPFIWYTLRGKLTVSFAKWALHFGLKSFIINGLAALGLIYLKELMDRWITLREHQRVRETV
jgi:rod shape-determining protein MreD